MTWYAPFLIDKPLGETLCEAKEQYQRAVAPITKTLIWIVLAVFAVQVISTTLLGVRSIRVFTTGSFKFYPALAWLFAPVLHAGIGHLGANIGSLYVFGIPIEQHFSKRRFGLFIVATAYLSTAGGWLLQSLFTTQQVAMYGISGTVFALGGFGLVNYGSAQKSLPAYQLFALVWGVAAAINVSADPFIGPYFHHDWINGGHATGFLIGVLIGLWRQG
jgi:membrane associated rhomboid family serine protease